MINGVKIIRHHNKCRTNKVPFVLLPLKESFEPSNTKGSIK